LLKVPASKVPTGVSQGFYLPIFFGAALALRVGSARSAASYAPLTQLEERSGIVGELAKRTLQSASDSPNPTYLTAWFATERVARAWQALHRSEPFD
jgi:hypothetical protein